MPLTSPNGLWTTALALFLTRARDVWTSQCFGGVSKVISRDRVGGGGRANQVYLVSLSDGVQIVARLGFPFPYSVHCGEAFEIQEEDDRARIPYRLLSEVEIIRYVAVHTQHIFTPSTATPPALLMRFTPCNNTSRETFWLNAGFR
ncbi:hypothetical protein BV25DRAFT_1321242 [Artomyces pyxidatus]|uniref:Uncharacterized protein n=1 Tax=Artomyces pyxidatus TaxID=48021 RepID=A0ACB8SNF2_9AGAM|nr:hypothetical protein BV25DRAFT_1321242 [Artomyces pyxidatus]